MEGKKLAVLFLVACLIVAGYIVTKQRTNTQAVDTTHTIPKENPDISVPEGAYASCEGKKVKDVCYFIINDQKNDGVCQDIYGTLTCGPSFDDEST